jgi:hypothetical protein
VQPSLVLQNPLAGADGKNWQLNSYGPDLYVWPKTDAGGDQPLAAQFIRAGGHFKATGDLYEKLRTVPLGHWTAVPYNAGNYTGSGGAWTVEAGDQARFGYTLIGNTMILQAVIASTSVAAGSSTLSIAIPGGKVAAQTATQVAYVNNAGAGWTLGFILTTAGSGTLGCLRDPGGTAWSASTNTTSIYFNITFEVS